MKLFRDTAVRSYFEKEDKDEQRRYFIQNQGNIT